MPRLAYVNGRYAPLAQARIHVEDRGLQFADSVYEVAAILNGRLLDWEAHLARMHEGREALGIAAPASDAALGIIAQRLVSRNRLRDGTLYVQLTRGQARRDHAVPKRASPSLIMVARSFDFASRHAQLATGVSVVTMPDERWARPCIKSTALLPNVLAKEAARRKGAFEAWLVDEHGHVTEGSSTNAWIVERGVLFTTPLSPAILAGITRSTLLRLARGAGMRVEERRFTPEQAQAADEAFLSSTTAPLLPVVAVDGVVVGDGRPGALSRKLGELIWEHAARQTGWLPLSSGKRGPSPQDRSSAAEPLGGPLPERALSSPTARPTWGREPMPSAAFAR